MKNYKYKVKNINKLNDELKRVCKYCYKKISKTNKQGLCSQMCKSFWNGTRIKFKCENCGKTSADKKAHYNKVNHHFCSLECRNEWQKEALKGVNNPNYKGGDIYCKCDYCNKEIHMKKHEYERLEHHFCNRNCFAKWLSNQESYMKGKHLPEEAKKKISEANKGRTAWNKGKNFPQFSRENNPNWNPNLTDEERVIKRKYKEYEYFRNEVFKRDNYTCQLSGQVGGKLVVHHLNGYNLNKLERLDVNNGITLTEKIHKLFHKMYGYGNNTKEQFEEFKIKYKNNEVA